MQNVSRDKALTRGNLLLGEQTDKSGGKELLRIRYLLRHMNEIR